MGGPAVEEAGCTATVEQLTASVGPTPDLQIVDVRNPGETHASPLRRAGSSDVTDLIGGYCIGASRTSGFDAPDDLSRSA